MKLLPLLAFSIVLMAMASLTVHAQLPGGVYDSMLMFGPNGTDVWGYSPDVLNANGGNGVINSTSIINTVASSYTYNPTNTTAVIYPQVTLTCGENFNYTILCDNTEPITGYARIDPGSWGYYDVTTSMDGYTYTYYDWDPTEWGGPSINFDWYYCEYLPDPNATDDVYGLSFQSPFSQYNYQMVAVQLQNYLSQPMLQYSMASNQPVAVRMNIQSYNDFVNQSTSGPPLDLGPNGLQGSGAIGDFIADISQYVTFMLMIGAMLLVMVQILFDIAKLMLDPLNFCMILLLKRLYKSRRLSAGT